MQRLHFLGQVIPSAVVLEVGTEISARRHQIERVQMLLGAGSQPHKISTQGSTEFLVFLFGIDHHHLQALLAML